MYLDPYQVSPDVGAERSPSVASKLTALVGLVAEVLALHAAPYECWRVVPDMDWRLATDAAAQRNVRLEVLGDPARYASVRWTGTGRGYDPNAPSHEFEIFLTRGTGDGEKEVTEARHTAAEAAFRTLCEGEGLHDATAWTAPPGLLYALRRQESVTTESGVECALGAPTITAAPGRRRPDPSAPDDRHEIVFTITLD